MRLSLSTYGTHRIRQNTTPPKVVRAFIDGEKSGKRIQVENRDWSEFWVKSKMYIYGHKKSIGKMIRFKDIHNEY